MTTPNIDLYMPKTYIFERKGKSYGDVADMTQQATALDFVYLPRGLSMVTVMATGMAQSQLKIWLNGPGYREALSENTSVTNTTQRIWTGQISNPGDGNQGRWLKIQAWNVPTAAMNNGSVSVQIINFPPEN